MTSLNLVFRVLESAISMPQWENDINGVNLELSLFMSFTVIYYGHLVKKRCICHTYLFLPIHTYLFCYVVTFEALNNVK